MNIKEPTRQEIARLAYSLFEERGCKPGHDVEDWLAAEAHLCTDEKHVLESFNPARQTTSKRVFATE